MDTHIHIHLDLSALAAISHEQGVTIMEDIASLNAKMTALVETVNAERTEVQSLLGNLKAQVAELAVQVSAGVPVTQADLDAFGVSLDAAIAGVTQISEAFPVVPVDPVVPPDAVV
jgi:seryl-tRNA synthetase